MTDCNASPADSGKASAHVPAVCAYRECNVCMLSDASCGAPCSARGFALAIWMAGYHRTHTQVQVLDRLCNPREYESDAEYEPYFAFLGAAK